MNFPRLAFLSSLLLAACFPMQDGDDPSSPVMGYRQPADTTVESESPLVISLRGPDSLADKTDFATLSMPAGASMQEGRVVWTPTWNQVGEHLFRISVRTTGGQGKEEILAFKVKVYSHPLVYTPAVDTIILAIQQLKIPFSRRMPWGDTVVLELADKPAGASIQEYGSSWGLHVDWKPASGLSGVFRIAGTAVNRLAPIVRDSFSFRVTVVASAPERFVLDSSGGTLRIGNFAPLETGRQWIYSSRKEIANVNGGETVFEGRYEVRVEGRDSAGRYTVGAKSISGADTSVATYHCSLADGCGTHYFLDHPMPFYVGKDFTGSPTPFVSPLAGEGPTLEYWNRSSVYVIQSPLGFLRGYRFISEVGLVSYHSHVISSLGGRSYRLRLLEFR